MKTFDLALLGSAALLAGGVCCTAKTSPGTDASYYVSMRDSNAHVEKLEISPAAAKMAGLNVAEVYPCASSPPISAPARMEVSTGGVAHVSPLVGGRLSSVLVSLGSQVEVGQVLGQVQAAEAVAVGARLLQTEATLEAAEAALIRQRQLDQAGIGARRQLIEAEARASELRAERQGLTRQLSVVGVQSRRSVALVSPVRGIVSTVKGVVGETVAANQIVFVVTDPAQVWLKAMLSESNFWQVDLGARATVRFLALQDEKMTGTVTYLGPGLDDETRARPLRVTLDSPDPRLLSGIFATVEIARNEPSQVSACVRSNAVTKVDNQDVVFVPGTTAAEFLPRAVKVRSHYQDDAVIETGLAIGETYVKTGAFFLKSALMRARSSTAIFE